MKGDRERRGSRWGLGGEEGCEGKKRRGNGGRKERERKRERERVLEGWGRLWVGRGRAKRLGGGRGKKGKGNERRGEGRDEAVRWKGGKVERERSSEAGDVPVQRDLRRAP